MNLVSFFTCLCILQLNDLNLYVPWIILPPNPSHLLPRFQLAVTSFSIESLGSLGIMRSFPHQNPRRVFYASVVIIS